jgi:Transposase DDE domain
MFEELFFRFLEKCHRHTAGHSFRVKVPVFTQDATLVSLCLSSFKWAKYRRRKGALKLHTLLDHEGCLPSFIRMTSGKVHEIRVVKDAQYDFPALPPDSILTVDRGYMDYAWLNSLNNQSITFIIPSKCNMAYHVVGQHKEPNKKRGILEDQLIEFVNYYEQKAYPQRIRHIRYRYIDTKGKDQEIEVLTNNMELAASTISALYKGRWEIETFFRWIKQNLKIKSFYGTSENAVMTQVWVAMILYLLLSFIKFQTKYSYTMLELLRVIRERVLGFESLLELLRVNWERLKLNQSYGVQTAFY